jgi:membrane protein
VQIFKRFYYFCDSALRHFLAIHGLVRASALAYTTLLALVPLSMVAFGVLNAFPAFSTTLHQLNRFVFRHFVPASADTIHHYLVEFASQASKLSFIGVIFSIITAVMLIYTMEDVFNAVWEVKIKKHRQGVSAFLLYWAIITLFPLVLGAAFAASVYIYSLPHVSSIYDTLSHYFPFFFLLPLAFTWLGFFLLYMILPNFKVRFRHAALGAMVAAIFFEIIKALFATYVSHFSSDIIIYGTLAAIPSFLVWLYISWIIVIFGAVIAHLAARP